MFISEKDKFIFFHVPKTAGSSIHIALKDMHDHGRAFIVRDFSLRFEVLDRSNPDPEIHHMGPAELLKIKPRCESYFKFAFVRNPFERLLSAYSEFANSPNRSHERDTMLKYKDFAEFCLDFPNSSWSENIHFVPMSDLICCGDEILVDFVGRFENLHQDLDKVCSLIPIEGIKLESKHRETTHDPYGECYTSESRKVIEDYFAKDLEIFGYSF